MTLSQLKQAQELHAAVTGLDNEIAQIQKLAEVVGEGGAKSSVQLTVQAPARVNDEKAEFDEDGSLINRERSGGISRLSFGVDLDKLYRSIYGEIPAISGTSAKPAQPDGNTIQCDLTDNLTFNILAVLLCDKQEKRKVMLRRLSKIGVEL